MREQEEKSIVGNYYRLEPKERMDIIIYHFDCFPAMIRDYEMELEDMIITCRAMERQDSIGDLGVRIQSGSYDSSPTDSSVYEKLEVEQIIKSGVLDRYCRELADADEIERGLMELKLMRHEYARMKVKLGTLKPEERDMLMKYVRGEFRALELSEELIIKADSVRKKICRIKKKLYGKSVDHMATYSDDTIYLARYFREV